MTEKSAKIYYLLLSELPLKSNQKVYKNLLLLLSKVVNKKLPKSLQKSTIYWYLQKSDEKVRKNILLLLSKIVNKKLPKSLQKSTIYWVTYKKWQKSPQKSTTTSF